MSRVNPTFDIGFSPPAPMSATEINAGLAAAQQNYNQYPVRIQSAISGQLGQAAAALAPMQTTIANGIARQLQGKATTLANLQSAVQQPIVGALEMGYTHLTDFAPPPVGAPAPVSAAPVQPAPTTSPPQQYELRNQLLGLSGPGGFPTQVTPCACDDAGVCIPPGCDTLGGGNQPPPTSYWGCYRKTDGTVACNIFGQGIPLPLDFAAIVSGPYTTLVQCQANCQQPVTKPKAYYCVYQGGQLGINCLYCDGTGDDCDGDIIGGPYATAAECNAACVPTVPPPPPPGGFYCLQRRGDPQQTMCQSAPIPPDLLQFWRVLSGPYPDQATCQAACKVGIIGCPPPVCPPPTGNFQCCPPANIEVNQAPCPPPVIQNLITVGGSGGTIVSGGGPDTLPCGSGQNPTCEVTSTGQVCPKPEGGDEYWWLDTCSDEYKLAQATEYDVPVTGGWGGGPVGKWWHDQLGKLVGTAPPSLEDPPFWE